jgi:hypothetical protein
VVGSLGWPAHERMNVRSCRVWAVSGVSVDGSVRFLCSFKPNLRRGSLDQQPQWHTGSDCDPGRPIQIRRVRFDLSV